MATNGTELALEARAAVEKLAYRRQSPENRTPEPDYLTPEGAKEPQPDSPLAPMVDKIAYGIARGLALAVKELEDHIASEARRVGDAVEARLDALQASMHDLTKFVGEQRSTNSAVQDRLEQLTAAGADLKEADSRRTAEVEALRSQAQEFSVSVAQRIDASAASMAEAAARQSSELEALRAETREFSHTLSHRLDATVASVQESEQRQSAGLTALKEETKALSQSLSERIDGLCKEMGIHQEDIAATKETLATFCSRVDAFVVRLDRQADAVRSMCTVYSQRESELQQLVDMLAKSRAYPLPVPTNGL